MSGSLGASIWKQWHESVDSRASIQGTGARVDRECVIPTIFQFSRKRKESDQNVVQKVLERKVDSAVQLYEAEAEVEARNWEKEILTSLVMRSIENLNLKDFSNVKQVDGRIKPRDTKSACVQNWSSSKKIVQEVAKKLKNWEETALARQARIDDLFMHQEMNPTTVRQLTT